VTYLLDSDWLIDFLNGDPAALTLVSPLFAAGLSISIITFIEIYHGHRDQSEPPRGRTQLPRIPACGSGTARQPQRRPSCCPDSG
jgi:hypothetical protein